MDAGSQVGGSKQDGGVGAARTGPLGGLGGLGGLGASDGVGWAVAAGLAVAAVFVPDVFRGALFVVAGLVAAVTGCPRWFGVLLVAAGVPILLLAAVTGSYWFG